MPALPVILGVVFIILKLCGVIAWSWIWVLSPFWIAAIIAIVVLIVFGLGFLRFSKKWDEKMTERWAGPLDRRSNLW